ncbi:hypothetical protein DsansV1_C25g0188651 [Dioscorea sansibarensis]
MFSHTSELEAHRYLQDLGKIVAAMEAEKIAPRQRWYIWRRNLWAINIVLRSYLATSSASPVSFREVPRFPSVGAEHNLPRDRNMVITYLFRCTRWINDLEQLVFQGHPSTPERVRNIYQRIESMKTDIIMAGSLSTLLVSTATSNNSHGSPQSPFETSKQFTESMDEPDIASVSNILLKLL